MTTVIPRRFSNRLRGRTGRRRLVGAFIDQLPVGEEPEPPRQQEGDHVEAADDEEERTKAGHERDVLEAPTDHRTSRFDANDMSADAVSRNEYVNTRLAKKTGAKAIVAART